MVTEASLNLDSLEPDETERLKREIRQYIKEYRRLPPTTIDYYKFVKLVGKGAFGKVTLGVHKLTGKKVAIKTIEKSYMKDDFSRKKVLQEVYILKKIQHSNVIRLLEVFESSKHLLIVMEYSDGGDLLKYVKTNGRLNEERARIYFKNIAIGLAHCHCRSVLHRDIKLDNILLDSHGGVKICDFGVSKILKKDQMVKEQCGTPAYIAPEVIGNLGYVGYSVDVWSLGVLLYAMLCGTVPFKAPNMKDLHKVINRGEFSFPCNVSQEAEDLVRSMLMQSPDDRLCIPEILNHPWVKASDAEYLGETDLESDVLLSRKKCQIMMDDQSGKQGINKIDVENLFPGARQNPNSKLSYLDHEFITENHQTMHIDEEALKVVENFGYPKSFV